MYQRSKSCPTGCTGRKEQNMTNIKKRAARAEIVSDIEDYLIHKADALREDAKYDLGNCPVDEETGKPDVNNWRYESAQQKNEKADMIESVLKDLEKF